MMEGLKKRTRDYALNVVRLSASLPRSPESQVLGRQLLRSGTSVGANFRESLRGRSRAEYATKLNLALMELEESLYWFELIEAAGIKDGCAIEALRKETGELSAIFVSLIKRAKDGRQGSK
jgi:four helix bundle protein